MVCLEDDDVLGAVGIMDESALVCLETSGVWFSSVSLKSRSIMGAASTMLTVCFVSISAVSAALLCIHLTNSTSQACGVGFESPFKHCSSKSRTSDHESRLQEQTQREVLEHSTTSHSNCFFALFHANLQRGYKRVSSRLSRALVPIWKFFIIQYYTRHSTA